MRRRGTKFLSREAFFWWLGDLTVPRTHSWLSLKKGWTCEVQGDSLPRKKGHPSNFNLSQTHTMSVSGASNLSIDLRFDLGLLGWLFFFAPPQTSLRDFFLTSRVVRFFELVCIGGSAYCHSTRSNLHLNRASYITPPWFRAFLAVRFIFLYFELGRAIIKNWEGKSKVITRRFPRGNTGTITLDHKLDQNVVEAQAKWYVRWHYLANTGPQEYSRHHM